MPESTTPAPQEGGIPDAVSFGDLQSILMGAPRDPASGGASEGVDVPNAPAGLSINFSATGGVADMLIAIRSGVMADDSSCSLGQAILAAGALLDLVKQGFAQRIEAIDTSEAPAGFAVAAMQQAFALEQVSEVVNLMSAAALRATLVDAGVDVTSVKDGTASPERVGRALVSRPLLERLGFDPDQAYAPFGKAFLQADD